jgi:hypothetical protein
MAQYTCVSIFIVFVKRVTYNTNNLSPDHLLRAASHTRLRARDHCTSSNSHWWKAGVGPSLLHTTLEGPME